MAEGVPHLGEDPATARRRVFGTPYTEAILGIRRALPPGYVYVIINMDDEDDGFPLWVRYDLAPHRAIYLGRLSQLPPNVRRDLPRGGQPIVLTYGSQAPPQLISRRDFLDWFESPNRTRMPQRDDAPAGPR
jgi:hypothetical protein